MRKVLGGFFALTVFVWLAVWGWARTPSFSPLGSDERAAVMRLVRDAVDGKSAEKQLRQNDPLGRTLDDVVIAALFDRGSPVARGEGRGRTLGDAARAAASSLAVALDGARVTPEIRARGRLKIDVVLARAPILTQPAVLFALSLVPGVDGLGLELAGREIFLTTDDLQRADLLATEQPTAAAEFELGLDGPAVLRRLAQEAGASGAAWRASRKKFFRFRADAFIEAAAPADRARGPLPVVRGHLDYVELHTHYVESNSTQSNELNAAEKERLRAAAIAGGRYLLRHLDGKGRFGYEYYTLGDEELTGPGYSLPRHSGGAYFLSQLFRATHDQGFADGALRALQFLKPFAPPGCDRAELACVGEPEEARVDIGSSALALSAAVEYEEATGDARFHDWAGRLARFLLSMQKADGDFCHLYEPAAARRDEQTKLLYFSGEAAFALARWAALAHDKAAADAARRGLDYLTGAQYAFFAGKFFFGEDHWTCLAADAAWPLLDDGARRRYARFCDDFAEFLRRTQFTDEDPVTQTQRDFAGAYGFSPLLPPHLTPVGSRSEAALASFAMDRRLGQSGAATREQILRGLEFVLPRQITDDNAWLMANPEAARGAFLMSDVKRFVRIDFVQHLGSALLRAADLL